jgi:hypothetical protein
MSDQDFYGQDGTSDAVSDYHAAAFATKQALGKLHTTMPVMVVAVHGGGTASIPTVDVRPLVNQIDGVGKATPHGVIYGIPCQRLQGGNFAIINDPKVGDLGTIHVCARDTSSVVKTGAQANPGSRRRFNLADSFYIGCWGASGSPTQFLQFTDTGITLTDLNGNTLVMAAGVTTLTTPIFKVAGQIQATGEITAGEGGADSVTLQNHSHGGGPVPTPGT